MKYRRTIFSILALALLCACGKEIPVQPEAEVTRVIHYVASVQGGPDTKATVDDGKHYIFEAGDRLFITSGENMYGDLILTSGVGDNSAIFEGELNCVGGFEPTVSTPLSATLVSLSDRLHVCDAGKVTAINDYPNEFASDFADAVRKYSHLTASGTYGGKSFSLTQNSSFLLFTITLDSASNLDTPAQVVLKIGNETIRSGSVGKTQPAADKQVVFAVALPSGTNFSSAKVEVDGTSYSLAAPSSGGCLLANNYYSIARPLAPVDVFTVEARAYNVAITFQYTGSGIQYNLSADDSPAFPYTWQDYNSKQAINLNTGERVYFRGKKASFGGKLVNSTGPYAVYGELMSLCCNDDYVPSTTAPTANEAFKSAFDGDTWLRTIQDKYLTITITQGTPGSATFRWMFRGCTGIVNPPVERLALPVLSLHTFWYMFEGCTSLTSSPLLPAADEVLFAREACFEGMFMGCSSLTDAPELPYTELKTYMYKEMFMNCTSLVNAPVLPATVLSQNCYESMFKGCTSLRSITCLATSGINQSNSTVNWVNGIPAGGTFTKASSTTVWPTGNNGIPSGWSTSVYSAP